MRFLYDLGIQAYRLLLLILSPFNTKAKAWVLGRKAGLRTIEQQVALLQGKPIWFHFASLGEFEQGRSVMEQIRKVSPSLPIVVTFFSPSGYQIRKNTPLADCVFYLPVDTRKNARAFISIVNPRLAIFTKYEYWYHYFRQLKQQGIPLLMISAIFRENQLFFKAYGSFYRKMLFDVSYFFAQNKESVHLLKWIGVTHAGLTGDTRFDRVVNLPAEATAISQIDDFVGSGQQVLVAGSSWPADEELLAQLLSQQEDVKLLIAPHEVHPGHIKQLLACFNGQKTLLYSQKDQYDKNQLLEARVFIVDQIGLLSSLYGYGDVAYIGGGFGAGIHNTLEAATYGVPVIFGPRYEKFQEAVDLIQEQAGFSIGSFQELREVFLALRQPAAGGQSKAKQAGDRARAYVQRSAGATSIIMKYLQHQSLLDE